MLGIKALSLALILIASVVSLAIFFLLFQPEKPSPKPTPAEFGHNDNIDVYAVELSSANNQRRYDYYSIPFCKPNGHIQHNSENMGEVLRGDRIVNTPHKVNMRADVSCASVCNSPDNPININKVDSERLIKRITEDYQVHLVADDLPSVTRFQLPESEEIFWDYCYKLGYLSFDGKVYVNNHVQFSLKYHEHTEGDYQIVGFEIEPRSMKWDSLKYEGTQCSPKAGDWQQLPPQELVKGENSILWTYSVKWDRSEVKWASRWNTNLNLTLR